MEPFTDLRELCSSLTTIEPNPSRALHEEVVDDREWQENQRILVEHADAVLDGILRRRRLDACPVEDDLAGVGSMEPREDLHQGGFAGAVLPEQAVQSSRFDGQVDAVVGANRSEVFVDVTQLETHVGRRLDDLLPTRMGGVHANLPGLDGTVADHRGGDAVGRLPPRMVLTVRCSLR